MRRFFRWAVGTAITQTVVMVLLAWLLPGFPLGWPRRVFLSALSITLVVAIAWPFIDRIAIRPRRRRTASLTPRPPAR
jgi:Kef-type K+ transport system membrane component KefB